MYMNIRIQGSLATTVRSTQYESPRDALTAFTLKWSLVAYGTWRRNGRRHTVCALNARRHVDDFGGSSRRGTGEFPG
jgi:hypothetical protein